MLKGLEKHEEKKKEKTSKYQKATTNCRNCRLAKPKRLVKYQIATSHSADVQCDICEWKAFDKQALSITANCKKTTGVQLVVRSSQYSRALSGIVSLG